MSSGRHRQDPGGHRRYLVAGLGIFLVLVLLATGGYALYSVLTGAKQEAVAETESRAGRASVVRQPAPSASRQDSSGAPTLRLTVTGERSYVSVQLPDGKALLNKTLRGGSTVRFDRPRLEVTIGDPDAVRVWVEGERRDSKNRGIDTFTVSRGE